MTDLINRTELVAFMMRILDRLEDSPDVSTSYRRGFRAAMEEVEMASPVSLPVHDEENV